MKKAALHNLGCKVNSYETEAMREQLEEAGYEIVSFNEKADVYIINTCTVTNIADRKSRQMLHKAKKKNPESIVVAVGCYVQAAEEELKKDISVDIIIGNNRKSDIIKIIEQGTIKSDVIDINKTCEYEEVKVKKISGLNRANIKVQDGCNQFCSYCIIPYTRGRVRSRDSQEIISEISNLSKKGCKEVVLTGIHTASYGVDFDQDENLLSLIKKIHLIEGIERIRLSSLEQGIVTELFAKELSGLKKVCPHFHLSLQSGSDGVLSRMNRKYNSDDYYQKCLILRKYFENPAITTDIIVGFPGETQEEFNETYDFIKKVSFADVHIFKYSKRKGTKAAEMKNQVPENIKNERSEKLINVGQEMRKEYLEYFIGKEREVLFEDTVVVGEHRYQVGHTMEHIKIAIPFMKDVSNEIFKLTPYKLLTGEILLAEL